MYSLNELRMDRLTSHTEFNDGIFYSISGKIVYREWVCDFTYKENDHIEAIQLAIYFFMDAIDKKYTIRLYDGQDVGELLNKYPKCVFLVRRR